MINNFEDSVIVIVCGGVGNIMFQIGAASCYAKKYSKKLYVYFGEQFGINVERRQTYDGFFERYDIIDTLPHEYVLIDEDKMPQLSFINFPDISNIHMPIVLHGYFQDERYLDKSLMVEMFSPNTTIADTIFNKYGDLSEYVSINTRRGDYVNLGWELPSNYYLDAYNTYFENQKVIVIGEDVEWNKKNITIDGAIYAENNKPLIDLYINYFCHDNILYNGTFGWWGAYLSETSNKKIIIPKSWNSNLQKNNNRWIKL